MFIFIIFIFPSNVFWGKTPISFLIDGKNKNTKTNDNKYSDRSMEAYLLALLGDNERQADKPTNLGGKWKKSIMFLHDSFFCYLTH